MHEADEGIRETSLDNTTGGKIDGCREIFKAKKASTLIPVADDHFIQYSGVLY